MTDQETEKLRAHAAQLATTLPEEDQAAFVAIYLDVFGRLNTDVKALAAALAEDLAPILIAYAPGRPGTVQGATDKATGVVMTVVNHFLSEIAPFGVASIRNRIVGTVAEAVKLAGAAVSEQQSKLEQYHGVPKD